MTGCFLTAAPLNYISLHSKSYQKSVRIYLPAGTWNFWGAKKDTCTNIHACVAKRAMWWLRTFCRETLYVRFTRIFRLLTNIVYRVHLARFALYRVHIAWSLQKNTAQGWSQTVTYCHWLAYLMFYELKTASQMHVSPIVAPLHSCPLLSVVAHCCPIVAHCCPLLEEMAQANLPLERMKVSWGCLTWMQTTFLLCLRPCSFDLWNSSRACISTVQT